ncbi:hypothetical protein CBS9595_003706 [Malassezia furfur]|nr:hypothetical protein CBS9595_003706 [Malassezia furfur]
MKQFTVPAAAGISYSFTNDGHFEMAKLAYSSNAEKPDCFEAQLIWQHGTYVSNTSTITMNPYKGDGAVQTVSPCNPEATRVQMSVYSETEFISNWTTYIETQPAFLGNEDDTVYSMQMYAFDGQPYAKLYLVYDPPNMLPQEQLFMNVVGASS